MVDKLTVGDATVLRVEEMVDRTFRPAEFLLSFDRAVFEREYGWMAPDHYNPETDCMSLSMHSWVIRTGRHTVLVDTCIGNHKDRLPREHWHMQDGPWLDRLAAAGVRPEEIDYVMCTHLHPDHVGWNTRLVDGRWVPTFPNAKYLFGKTEYEFWQANPSPASARRNAIEDSVLPIIEAGRAVMIDDGHAIDDLFTVEASPGHSPGHANLRLKSAGEQALFTGDAIHHPIQVLHPDWATVACQNPKLAIETRKSILADCVETGALMCPQHFVAPHCGHVKAAGDGFRFAWWGEG